MRASPSHPQNETHGGADAALPARRVWQARVHSAQELGSEVVSLGLKLADGAAFRFVAGQHVRLQFADDAAPTLAIASAPSRAKASMIEVHLHVPRRSPSPAVPPVQSEVLVDGPFGDFRWRERDDRPVVLLASGACFAGLKSMAEHALDRHRQRSLHIYWGADTRDELYLHGLVRSWAEANDHVYYTPVLRAPRRDDLWGGRTGDALDVLLEDLPDLSEYRIYLSAEAASGDAIWHRLIGEARANPDELFATWRAGL